jgi:hypothetical protein
MYGNSSDYYNDLAREKEEKERLNAINSLKELGYKENNLGEFETYQLNAIYNRINELKRQKRIDEWILRLNENIEEEGDF